MQRVEIRRGDVALSCLDSGSGEDVVVLLHGLAGSALELLPTATSLLPDHRAIVIDQRGHGHSTRRPGDLSRRAYVSDVVSVLKERAVDAPVTLVGQSMGGHTAMLTAAWVPAVVRRLVMLEAGVGGADTDDYPSKLGTFFASWPVPFRDKRAAAEFLGTRPIAQSWISDLEERSDGWWPRFDPDVTQGAITPVAERARWHEWEQIKVRTLLVTGQRGSIPEAEIAGMLATGTAVTHAVVPNAGHDVHLEQHDAWVRVLRRRRRDPCRARL